MSNVAITAQNLSKRYRLFPEPAGRIVEWITCGKIRRHTDFWALRDFSFTVERGECVAILGPNGAGKSTLLKILSQALTPTSGSFQINGRALSLLELGTGFNMDLTGRQNVFETTSLLGFSHEYVLERLADIERFSELGEFFNRPLRTYSSGMLVRLAFSVFACMEPDVFIVDEALAVGDVGFQRKCYRRLEELIARGMTCLFVSHDFGAVVQFCRRAYVLMAGSCVFSGDPREAVNLLNKSYFGEATPAENIVYGDGSATIESIWFEDPAGNRIVSAPARTPVVFCYTIRFARDVPEVVCGFHIKTLQGVEVVLAVSNDLGYHLRDLRNGTELKLRWSLDLNLNAGTYFFGCGCRYPDAERFLCRRVDAVKFPVVDLRSVGGLINPVRELRVDRQEPSA